MELNGWNAARLNDLARDVEEIKHTLGEMRSAEIHDLRNQLKEAQQRPKLQFRYYILPIICAIVPAIIILIGSHV